MDASVVARNGANVDEPCVEVCKLRAVDARGELVFDRWCYKHHHWLNDAPPQRTVADVLEEDARRWKESRRG